MEWTVLTGSRPGRTGAPRRGERGDNERILPPKLQYYTDKHHLHHFMKKKKRKLHPLSIIQPLLTNQCFLLFLPPHPFPPAPLQVDQLMCDELFESLQVLSIELHVIVSGPLHPERLHGALATFVQRQAVGEVDDLVLCTVDHQHR